MYRVKHKVPGVCHGFVNEALCEKFAFGHSYMYHEDAGIRFTSIQIYKLKRCAINIEVKVISHASDVMQNRALYINLSREKTISTISPHLGPDISRRNLNHIASLGNSSENHKAMKHE
jgi:hypothetical protein